MSKVQIELSRRDLWLILSALNDRIIDLTEVIIESRSNGKVDIVDTAKRDSYKCIYDKLYQKL